MIANYCQYLLISKYYKEVNKSRSKKTLDNEIPKGPAVKKPDYVSKAPK